MSERDGRALCERMQCWYRDLPADSRAAGLSPYEAEPATGPKNRPHAPVFHIPVGRYRHNGEVVLFDSHADQDSAIAKWYRTTIDHPATVAAGACVIIGPTTTSYMDLASRTAIQSRTADSAWEPSATSDPPGISR